MKITAIRQQVRNAERVSLYVDGKYAFSLSLGQLLSEKLKVGIELDTHRLAELVEVSQDEKLRLRAMNWTLLRPRSIKELSQYLAQKQSSEKKDVQWILDDFTKRGWVNDLEFAKWWISRSSRQKKSTAFLRSELAQKGVSRDIIAGVLDTASDTEALHELVQKLRTKPRYQDETKLIRYLMTKGFRYSSISEALAFDGEAASLD